MNLCGFLFADVGCIQKVVDFSYEIKERRQSHADIQVVVHGVIKAPFNILDELNNFVSAAFPVHVS